jgi:branched-chain amino acid transport system permease protein
MRSPLASALRTGLAGGAVALLVCLVGMVEAFSDREIIAGVLSLGQTLLLIIFFGTGYAAAKGDERTKLSPGVRIGQGALAGLVAAAILCGLVIVGGAVNLRAMFIHASPALYEILTFGLGNALGLALLLAVGAGMGAVAGGALGLPAGRRRALGIATLAVLMVGMLGDQFVLILGHHGLGAIGKGWFFVSKGITPLAAGLCFAIAFAAALLWQRYGGGIRSTVAAQPPARQVSLRVTTWVLLALFVLALPRLAGPYHSEVLNQVGIALLMGLGLNIVVGFAGMLDLGYVAFFAIGAYTVALLTSPESFLAAGGAAPFSFWTALPIAVFVAVLAGVLLGVPVLRLRGDYLAIVTLGFGEIIRVLAISEWLRPYLGGAQGISKIPPIVVPWVATGARCAALDLPICLVRLPIAGRDKPQLLFYMILAACLLAAFIAIRLKDSRYGRAWMAMREDEDVAEAMGIHLVSTKLMAFAVGAGLSGLSGALFGTKVVSIYPHSFGLLISINILAIIIVGGMGSIPGVIVGALVLVGLPEVLREFAEYRLMVYGAVLVLMMLKRPEGLVPNTVVRRELHERNTPSAPDATGVMRAEEAPWTS